MREKYCEYLAHLAQKSVLYEVSVSPKPGLVDRYNSGAHKDMNFFTFLSSASTLYNGFYEMAVEGMKFEGENLKELLDKIRPIGIDAEKNMLKVTMDVNTHKGIIFSLGIICAAAAHIYKCNNNKYINAEDICNKVMNMTKGITEKELSINNDRENLTNGEKLFNKYKLKGIRGEVESGFKTVREKGLSILREAKIENDEDLNNTLIQVLLNIMTCCEDTNVVSRHDIETLEYVQNYARNIVDEGGVYLPYGKEKVALMDKIFIEKNISPGGCADLLAVTIMMGMLEGINL